MSPTVRMTRRRCAKPAVLGLGVTQIVVPDALPFPESGALVRVLPGWYVDAGSISIYYSRRVLMPYTP